MRNYICRFHPVLNARGDRLQLKRLCWVKCCKPLPRFLSLPGKPLRPTGNLVVSIWVTPGPASHGTILSQKKISFPAKMWPVLLLSGDLRLLTEKRVGKRFCQEIKAGKNGLRWITNTIAPQQSLLLDFGEKRTKTNIYLAFTVYLVPAVSKFIDYSHLCETDVIPILQVGKLG